ncbi:hypothetical protein [Gluconobacter sp. Dm-44]|uniref:hypothetical protein n=1 Tax=Gluconobacter sp. Dm-44 TaxID=2799805 RepID=UPI001B8D38D8|nr:hypothetical protein [Gluconobacter sp. Dm-44]MBS1060516.1 hypothetical protein [Gluconobacter sp. Dm-44]
MTISFEALKKQARQESRSGALSYTQALEQLSQRHGFRTFAALKASSAKSSAVHAQGPGPGGSGNARLGEEMVGPIIIGTIRDDPHPISMDKVKAMGGKLFEMSFATDVKQHYAELVASGKVIHLGDYPKSDAS